MWIASKYGYFSIVRSSENRKLYMVRARDEKDLFELKRNMSFLSKRKVHTSFETDYCCRIFVSKEELDIIMMVMSNSVDYTNFKNMIKDSKSQKDKVPFYIKVWNAMFQYQYREGSKYQLNWDRFYDQNEITRNSR